jgi:hypothetical protein
MLLESAIKTLRGPRVAGLFFIGGVSKLCSEPIFLKPSRYLERTLVVAGMLYHPVNTLKFNQDILRDMPDEREATIGYWVGQTYSRINTRGM